MAAPWYRRRSRRPLTAAAGGVIQGGSPATPEALVKRLEGWQKKILYLSSVVPEPAGASALIRSTLDKVFMEVEGEGLNKGELEELNRQVVNFETGRAGQLIWLAGEVFPSWHENEDGEVEWRAYSPIELHVEPRKQAKLKGPDGKDIELTDPWYRAWQPDLAYSYHAWSAHKSLVDLLEAMYVHQLADTAVATSRLAGAGILYWPTDLPSMPLRDGRPEEGSRQELQEQLQHSMMESITERNSADAVVPLIVFGDPSTNENTKPAHILLERPDDAKGYTERMNGYAQRYARGVELPIESTMGMGPANHWTAWIIREDKWLEYVQPIAELLADSLTRNRIKPILRKMGKSEKVIRGVRVVANGDALITKSDLSEPAIKAAQIGRILSDDAIIRAIGFNPETDKFDPENDQINDGSGPGTRLEELPAQFRDNRPV